MQTCPECGGEARDTHSFCPNCRTPLSAAAKATGGSAGSGGGGDDGGVLDGATGVSRRDLLLYGGAAVGTAVVGGGTGFLLLSGGGGGDGPEATARTFVQSLNDGNVDDARGMLHPDSSLRNGGLGFVSSLFEEAEIGIDATEVVAENETDAEVRVETTATLAGETESDAAIVILRTQDGQWRVMNFESP